MPSVYSKTRPSTIQPFPVLQADFEFPTDKHLLITTPSRILSWDASGIHKIFKSSRSGIAAATESKDGSGILAIADKHVVILHDTQHGKEKSWGLSAPEDEVRHLEYTKDSKSLFLTTAATNAIQCYSTQAQQLLSPPQTLASPAVALAVSATGHLMISAQGSPPVVFLKDLTKNSTATLLKPQASTSGITIAAFHPERANIFLLAFDDGTLAVFDASLLKRGNAEGKYNDQSHAGKAEIGRKKQLHRPMHFKNEGRSRAISGAAFLPGNKLKTVTVGIDGRSPLTCVSVSGSTPPERGISTARKNRSSLQSGLSGHLIAVGGQDGSVRLYDLLGLLQGHKELGTDGERIISVEWVNGASPKGLLSGVPVDERAVQLRSSIAKSPAKATQGSIHKNSTPKHLSVHPALRPSTTNPIASTSMQTRRFTVHPDEAMGDSTVRHTPSTHNRYMVSAEAGEYLDLFSPVNPFLAEKSRANRDQSFSPSRIRPRISSKTFAQDMSKSKPESARKVFAQMPVINPELDSHATSSGSVNTSIKRNLALRPAHSMARNSPLKAERRRLNSASVRKRPTYQTDTTETVDASVVANAKLLRELRQMGARTASIQASGKTKGKASKDVSSRTEPKELSRPPAPVSATVVDPPLPETQGNVQVYGSGGRWPTDSIDEPSWSEEQQDDIWITSDEERNKSSRRVYGIERPAARQTSRSRMGSDGTFGYDQGVFGGVIVTDDFLDTLNIRNNVNMKSTVTAIYDIGCFVGAIAAFVFGDYFGRKKTILIGTTIMSIGAILQCTAYGVPHMIVGRIVAGIGNGMNTATAPPWQSETSQAAWRGKLIVIELIMNIAGFSLSNWVTFGFSFLPGGVAWRVPLALQFIFIFILYATVPWLPESPRWLVMKGRFDEAEQILADLEGTEKEDPYIQTQLSEIKFAADYERDHAVRIRDLVRGKKGDQAGTCTMRRLILGMGAQFMQQFSGINVTSYYLPTVLIESVGFSNTMARLLAAVNSVSYLLFSTIGIPNVERWGRRKMLMYAAAGQCFCYLIITVMIRYNELPGYAHQAEVAKASVAFFFLYYVFFGIGFQGVPWLYPAEINSLSMKNKGAALGTATNWMCNFIVVEITPIGISSLGWKFYIIWTVFNGAFVPLVYLFYPETAGRTLEDIDRYFMDHDNIFVFKDKVATSAKRPAEYIENEENQVRRHSSVNARAASMAVARYGDRMSVNEQGDNHDTKEKEAHKEEV
ncbi:hypothetical protein MBLNU13_g10110t2 [Cladosporium sp. NU13]